MVFPFLTNSMVSSSFVLWLNLALWYFLRPLCLERNTWGISTIGEYSFVRAIRYCPFVPCPRGVTRTPWAYSLSSSIIPCKSTSPSSTSRANPFRRICICRAGIYPGLNNFELSSGQACSPSCHGGHHLLGDLGHLSWAFKGFWA